MPPTGPTGPTGPEQGPEYLDSTVAPATHDDPQDRRKRLLALGGVVGAGLVIGGGAWAATSFFATGEQPAQALPSSTIAYASVDLDPSGGQKIEAIRTLKKFPAFNEEIDLETDDDLRERLFEEITKSGGCESLDFAKDVEPWLGSRAAVAAIDAGEEQPSPVFVLQVTDAAGAEQGIETLLSCEGEDSEPETGAWSVEGDWLVAAETQDIVDKVVQDAEESSLADDEAFGRWTGEAGEDGIMSFYVSKAAAGYYQELLSSGALGPMGMTGEGLTGAEGSSEEIPEELQTMLDEFDGGAATVRFDDGALEVEYAMSNYQPEITELFTNEAGVDLVTSLPADTVGAFGVGFQDGWVQGFLDYLEKTMPQEGMSVEDMLAEAEAQTGLALPEDIETLFGDGVAVAVGPGLDPDAIANGGPGEVPLGLRIAGDAGDVQAVLDKIAAQAGPEVAPYLQVTEGDGFAVLGLQEGYRSDLESEGSLGDSAAFQEVIDAEEAQSVLFVDFDADDGWLVRLSESDPKARENLEPLSALGGSAWVDEEAVHGLVKLTTD